MSLPDVPLDDIIAAMKKLGDAFSNFNDTMTQNYGEKCETPMFPKMERMNDEEFFRDAATPEELESKKRTPRGEPWRML